MSRPVCMTIPILTAKSTQSYPSHANIERTVFTPTLRRAKIGPIGALRYRVLVPLWNQSGITFFNPDDERTL